MGVWPASFSVYHVPAWCMERLEGIVRFPRMGVTGTCWLPRGCCNSNLSPLEEQPGFLAVDLLSSSVVTASSPSLLCQGHMNPKAWTVRLEVVPWRISKPRLQIRLLGFELWMHDFSVLWSRVVWSKSSVQRGNKWCLHYGCLREGKDSNGC